MKIAKKVSFMSAKSTLWAQLAETPSSAALLRLAVICLAFSIWPSCAIETAGGEDIATFATGFNLAGAEFGDSFPGIHGQDYIYPEPQELAALADRGFGLVRIPVRWERLQQELAAPLDADEIARLDRLVAAAGKSGQNLLIDVHNYGRYNGKVIGEEGPSIAAFSKFWQLLAERYGKVREVVFGVMNEPYDIDADHWARVNQAALNAIRQSGAENLVLLSGTAWSGAHSWQSPVNGRSNADALRNITDSCQNMAFEVHQYLDGDSSGTSAQCVSSTIGSRRIRAVTNWMRATGHRAFLGEFGAGDNQVCRAALTDLVDSVERNKDVWLGWAYWASGPWWPEDYPLLVRLGSADQPAVGTGRQAILDRYANGVGADFYGCK